MTEPPRAPRGAFAVLAAAYGFLAAINVQFGLDGDGLNDHASLCLAGVFAALAVYYAVRGAIEDGR